jgi:SusD family.
MKNIKSLITIVLLGGALTSCNDFLNLEPLNDIVLENFWTDKSDVESVLLGAYSALQSEDCIMRMSIWGEMRSDNIVEGNNAPDAIRQICSENLLITNQYCKYNSFYDVINRANTVLHFAPIVAEKDPNYVLDEQLAHQSEAIALRCLSYWYLIRSFRDVPYVTEPSIDDEGGYMKFYVPQSPFETVLDSIISDLEYAKKGAMNKYATDEESRTRITKPAICAMLADMYLWRGRADDWQKCIDVCEEVTAYKMQEYNKLKSKQGKNCELALFNGYPLISDAPGGALSAGNSYNEIFGNKCSFESLFELPFDYNVQNNFVNNYYQSQDNEQQKSVGTIKAYEPIGNAPSTTHDVFNQSNDVRYYTSIKQRSTSFAISKYGYSSVSLTINGGKVEPSSATSYGSFRSKRSSDQANWIIYRYSEVLLFEAEAYIMMAKGMKPAGADSLATVGEQNALKDKAFKLIDAVNARSVVLDNDQVSNTNDLAKVTNYKVNETAVSKVEEILFQERRRELLFEGKRWYDLVRMARRAGNQKELITFIKKKHTAANSSKVDIQLKNPYAMYFPMYRDEVRNSKGVLKQNPAYKDDEKTEQAH